MDENKAFDVNFLFSNFDSPNDTNDEHQEAVHHKVKKLRKQANKKSTLEDEETEESGGDTISPQNKYINELEQQNAKLKAIIKRMMGPQLFSVNDETVSDNISPEDNDEINLVEKLENDIQVKPFAIVLYLNNDVSTVHRKDIDEVMRAISAKKSTQDVLLAQKLQAQISAVPLKAFTANSKGRRNNSGKVKNPEEQYVICACQYFKSFFIDRMGAPLLESNPGVTDIWDVPAYQQLFMKALPIMEESLNVRVRQNKQCFNCGGDHHLDQCTEERDQQKINISRREHNAAKFNSPQSFQMQVTDEVDERYKHFKAGQISVGLEDALGISLDKQLPPYIYKMRSMGYPPGWMKPNEEHGLKMYNTDGVALEDPGVEEGEIKPILIPDVVKYPGFNAPLPEEVHDEYQMFNCPPFNPEIVDAEVSRKRSQILGYDENQPIVKKLNYESGEGEESDMELDETESVGTDGKPPLPLIETTDQLYKPPPPTKSDSDSEAKSKKLNGHEKKKDGKVKASKSKKSKRKSSVKEIDERTYRNWFIHEPFSSTATTYVIYTTPPLCKQEVSLSSLPRNPVTDLDREPWKTASANWCSLYGDLSVATGTYDSIRTLLKDKKSKRKPMM